jgi:putative ABC transport system permease protein
MAFAGLALALAVIGTYGVISYSVSQRKREIGIRMALGAQTEQILGRVVGEGLKLVMIGLGIGVAAALALTQLLKWLLFGIEAYDPPTFIAIAAMLMTAGVLACLVPALRAARVDPMVTLRNP